jgi:hypothetical protein
MENKLGDFILKRIEEKKTQRWIISSDDLFTLCGDMVIIDDDDIMMNIMEYLEENQIDVNFHNNKSEGYYRRWNELERKIKLRSMFKDSKTEVQKMIEKVNNIKIEDRPDWLELYKNDDEEPGEIVVKYDNQYQRITNMLMQELREQVDDEPEITLDEIQQEVKNEIIYRDNPIMGEMSGEELRNFLTNRVKPERFRENNNN